MSKFHSKDVSAFSLEGRFLSFELADGYKRKYLRLATSEGEWCIKLAKYLRSSFELNLVPGDWIHVVGEKNFNYKTGKIKLKAERVIPASASPEPVSIPVLAQPAKTKTKASILVCQKSTCMKRGGTAVCQALEAVLSDRGLENQVAIKGTGCLKQCKAGPNLVVMPDKSHYSRIQAEQIPELINKHFPDASVDEQTKPAELAVVGRNIASVK